LLSSNKPWGTNWFFFLARCWWLMAIIPATWEAEIGKISIPGQPEQIVLKTPISMILSYWIGIYRHMSISKPYQSQIPMVHAYNPSSVPGTGKTQFQANLDKEVCRCGNVSLSFQ
jgi:hypothetical protein